MPGVMEFKGDSLLLCIPWRREMMTESTAIHTSISKKPRPENSFQKCPLTAKNKVSAIYIQNFLHTYTHAFVTSKCLKWQHGKINTGSSLSCLTNILKNINTVILRKVHNFLITLPQTTLIREILYISVFKRAMAFLVLPWVTQNIAKKPHLRTYRWLRPQLHSSQGGWRSLLRTWVWFQAH